MALWAEEIDTPYNITVLDTVRFKRSFCMFRLLVTC